MYETTNTTQYFSNEKKVLAQLGNPKALATWFQEEASDFLWPLGYCSSEISRFKFCVERDSPMYILGPIRDMYVDSATKKIYIRAAHFISHDTFKQEPSFLSKIAIKSLKKFDKPISIIHLHKSILIYFKKQLVWGCRMSNDAAIDSDSGHIVSIDVDKANYD